MRTFQTRLAKCTAGVIILMLTIFLAGCATMTPEEQRAYSQKTIKEDMQRHDVQVMRPFAACGAKFGPVPEDGEFTGWGWPCMLYFGEKMIAQVTEVDQGLTMPRVVAGTIGTDDIREVKRAKSTEGAEAIVLIYDENISYYMIPWGVAELSPFGEITAFTTSDESNKAAAAERLAALLKPMARPRPSDAPPLLMEKLPSQFVKEPRMVEGIFQRGWNPVEIDHKEISLIFDFREITQPAKSTTGQIMQAMGVNPLAGKKAVPMLGYYKAQKDMGAMEKLMGTIPLYPVSPGRAGFSVEGVNYVATIVHAKDGSWRYRVELPEPVQ